MPNVHSGDRVHHFAWLKRHGVWAFLLMLLGFLVALPLNTYLKYGWNTEWMLGYAKTLPTNFPYWAREYGVWFLEDLRTTGIPAGLLPIVVALIYFSIQAARNPFDANNTAWGPGRFARIRDVVEMGVLKGWVIVLGVWKGRKLMFQETLSALCVAPPGTGKTVGVVVPTIFESHTASMIINDVKPELFFITSGYRQEHSHVIRLDWSAADDPAQGVFFPRWNPLSPRCMPPSGAERDLYIDRLVKVVIPDPGGNADPHWTYKGRSALTGFVHFITNKCENENYTNLPPQWQGEEPNFSMILDWITEALITASDKVEEQRKAEPNLALFADPVRNFLMDAVNEARLGNYYIRAIDEMTQLANTPEKERGSVLSTIDSGLTIFKNTAVRQRTSRSDFAFSDIRGMKDPDTGEMKPLSVYITVNQEDVKSLSVITGLFVETLSAYLVANKPEATDIQGNILGPAPVLFVLDEFPQMPKLSALIDGPAVGRGQKVSYLMIGQDLGQISAVYSEDSMNTILSTTAAKIVLPLNNERTAERFNKMVAHYEEMASEYSQEVFMGTAINPFKHNRSTSWKYRQTIRPDEFMNMPEGKHVVLLQGWSHRPLYCDTPYYFKHRKYKKLAGKDFGGNYPVAPPMPDFMYKLRVEEYNRDRKKAEAIANPGAVLASVEN